MTATHHDTPEQQDEDAECAEWVGRTFGVFFAALSREEKAQYRQKFADVQTLANSTARE